MGTTNEDVFRALRELVAAIAALTAENSRSRFFFAAKSGRSDGISLITVEATLSSILTRLNLLVSQASFTAEDFATQTTLAAILEDTAALETLGDTAEASRTASNSRLEAIKNAVEIMDSDTPLLVIDLAALVVDVAALEVLGDTAEASMTAINSRLEAIKNATEDTAGDWDLLSVNTVNLAAILVAVLNNATSGRQDTAQTSFDTMLTDNDLMISDLDAIRLSNITINTSLDNIEFDADQTRISSANIAASVIATGSSHTLNWYYDFTVGAAGSGSFIITLTVPAGQKLTNAWSSIIMPVRGSSETIEWHQLSAADVHTRRLAEKTIANTTTRYHMPNEEVHANDGHIDGRSQKITVPAGQKLQWTFSTDLSNNDQVQIRCGGDLRDGTVFAAATRTGTVTGTLNSEDHEEIA